MWRLGIVTLSGEDWAGVRLVEAARELADAIAISPMSFTLKVGESPSVLVGSEPAEHYDAFILRRLSSNGEAVYQFEVFELLSRSGVLVINSPASLSIAESKAETTFILRQAGLPVPRTVVTQDLQVAKQAVEAFGTAVIKPVYGSQGIGIEKVTACDCWDSIRGVLDSQGVVCIQEFVPHGGRDIRAFVVGNEVKVAMYRIAQPGEWRTNISLGATCEVCKLDPQMRNICIEAAKVVGLDYTGIDLVEGPSGPLILEVNGAPSWHGLPEDISKKLASDIIRHIVRKLERGEPAYEPMDLK